MTFEEIQKEILTLDNKGDLSDGYHSYNELYKHRMILFSIICNQNQEVAWKSRLHHDGTMFDGYFIVGIDTPQGQFTYHYQFGRVGGCLKSKSLKKPQSMTDIPLVT